MCIDNEDIEGRNNCQSDDECLVNGGKICDRDPNCFGVAWNVHNVSHPLKICRSRSPLNVSTPSWRTILKCMYTNF